MRPKLFIVLLITIFLTSCSSVHNTPYVTTSDNEQDIIYTISEEENFAGEIVNIDGNRIELDDGTMIKVTENCIITGNFVTLTAFVGPTNHEYYITEITGQGSLLVNPGSDILEVNIIDGEADVSGNVTIIGGNILQILDKRFIITDDTLFNSVISEGDPLLNNMLMDFEVGDFITGYGFKDLNNEITSGTIMKIMFS